MYSTSAVTHTVSSVQLNVYVGGGGSMLDIICNMLANWCSLVLQTVDIVYRKPPGVPPGELHPHVEEEQCHIQSFVNFVSSFLWANMLLRSKP